MSVFTKTLYVTGLIAVIIFYFSKIPYEYIELIAQWYDWALIGVAVLFYLVFATKSLKRKDYLAALMPILGVLVFWVSFVFYLFFLKDIVTNNIDYKEGLMSLVVPFVLCFTPAFIFHLIDLVYQKARNSG